MVGKAFLTRALRRRFSCLALFVAPSAAPIAAPVTAYWVALRVAGLVAAILSSVVYVGAAAAAPETTAATVSAAPVTTLAVGAVRAGGAGARARALAVRLDHRLTSGGLAGAPSGVELKLADDPDALGRLVFSGEVDIVFGYGIDAARALAGMPAARIYGGGSGFAPNGLLSENGMPAGGTLSGGAGVVIAVRADSDIRTLEDLVGRRVAFENSNDLAGFFAPVWRLLNDGLETTHLANPRFDPPSSAAGVLFAGHGQNLTKWLYRGVADAVAFSAANWRDEQTTPAAARVRFRPLYKGRAPGAVYAVLVSRRAIGMSDVIAAALAEPAPGPDDPGALRLISEDEERRLRAVASLILSARAGATVTP